MLSLLEVPVEDFDRDQPLTVYGLDSISAAKLSSILRPYGSFSQMQLLGGVPWSQIEDEIQSAVLGSQSDASLPGDGGSAMAIVLDVLGVTLEDFSPDIPLSSYGLDSLGASRLATALRPFMAVTQMQLMGQTTWAELSLHGAAPPGATLRDTPEDPLVEICGGSGVPLIILPGGNGSMALFFALRPHFRSGPLWALQITDATPLESLDGLVAFWKDQICAKRPRGPYRIAAYSASTLAGIALTKLLEDAGEEVLQLAFIDHCPALWTRVEAEALLRERTVDEFRAMSDESVLDMLRNDPSTGARAVTNYEAALQGAPDAPAGARREVDITRVVMGLIFEFLQQFYPTKSVPAQLSANTVADTAGANSKSYPAFINTFEAWLASVRAPLIVMVAEHGIVHSAPGGATPDLEANRFPQEVDVHRISGVGHYGLFADERVAKILGG